jgi:hypothetical protein
MIQPYFVQIATVRMAARLLDKTLEDNYAFHGALARFAPLELGDIKEADGLDDVPRKADSFKFGQLCGKILHKHLAEYDSKKMLACDARIARETFMKLTPEATAKYAPDTLRDSIKTVFRALFKKAQIRTHTAKPGSEDINAWLAAYNGLANDYDQSIDALVEEIVAPSLNTDDFFDRRDALIALALGSATPSAAQTDAAADGKPVSVLGIILKEIVFAAKA